MDLIRSEIEGVWTPNDWMTLLAFIIMCVALALRWRYADSRFVREMEVAAFAGLAFWAILSTVCLAEHASLFLHENPLLCFVFAMGGIVCVILAFTGIMCLVRTATRPDTPLPAAVPPARSP